MDAAFTLTYAIIMLNVDQHNHNAKKQNIPMTVAVCNAFTHNGNLLLRFGFDSFPFINFFSILEQFKLVDCILSYMYRISRNFREDY